MRKQGHADREVSRGKVEPRPYAINQNFPSQLGSAIDPKAVERMRDGAGYSAAHNGPTDGMGQGPGANRQVKRHGGQGRY
jgi:hypothetical protein